VILITIARDGSYCGGLRAAAESLSTNGERLKLRRKTMLGAESQYSPTKILLKLSVMLSLVFLWIPGANAVPSYSRQTGLACSSCHYTPPELTPFGRKFKLEGYTFATKPEVSDDKKGHNTGLNLLEAFPLSVRYPINRNSHLRLGWSRIHAKFDNRRCTVPRFARKR